MEKTLHFQHKDTNHPKGSLDYTAREVITRSCKADQLLFAADWHRKLLFVRGRKGRLMLFPQSTALFFLFFNCWSTCCLSLFSLIYYAACWWGWDGDSQWHTMTNLRKTRDRPTSPRRGSDSPHASSSHTQHLKKKKSTHTKMYCHFMAVGGANMQRPYLFFTSCI